MGALMALLGRLLAMSIAWIARSIVPLFGLGRLTGWFSKLLSFGLFTVGLPTALNWGLFKFFESNSSFVFSSLGLSSTTIELTQLGAWIGDQLNLPICFGIYMGFVAQRAVMNLVKLGGSMSKFTTNRY
jgi:hypothetical protein